jgi:hypothetical protein
MSLPEWRTKENCMYRAVLVTTLAVGCAMLLTSIVLV